MGMASRRGVASSADQHPLTASQVTDLLNQFQWPSQFSFGPQPASLLPWTFSHPTYDLFHGPWVGGVNTDGTPEPLCQWYTWRDNEIETGHMNFMEATFTGVLAGTPGHQNAIGHDDDVDNFYLDTSSTLVRNFGIDNGGYFPGGPGAVGPAPGPFLQLEFNYDETLTHFKHPTAVGSLYGNYWANFTDYIDSAPDAATNMIDSHEATVIALLGLDMVHPPPQPELHPVHAIAIRENNTDPVVAEQDDYWAFFARASGNEGKCSSSFHTLGTEGLVIEIPPPYKYRDAARRPLSGVSATLVASNVWFVTPKGDQVPLNFPTFFSSPNGTFLTLYIPAFHFEDPTRNSGDYTPNMVFGEIHVHWSPPNDYITINLPPTFRIKNPHREWEPEESEAKSWNMLSPGQQG
jgi:hypothetical protein